MSEEPKSIDKSGWGPGPWQHEPDHIEWRHRGVPCLMHRQPRAGHWCGYVAVEPGHPWHGVSWGGKVDEEGNYTPSTLTAEAHGGITYAEKCAGAICHVPQPGEPDDVWWLGFDCAHLGDISPGYEHERNRGWGESYKTLAYVRKETERLAEQVIAARTKDPTS